MNTLARACDHLDDADVRIALLNDLLGGASGEITLSPDGTVGLCAILRVIMNHIASARAGIDAYRGQPLPPI